MTADSSADAYASARAALVASLRRDVQDERVLGAIGRVPRERFIEPSLRPRAYEDHPLPIGHGQTISQPRIVAIMLAELHLDGDERVLEVGAGSGYQTALLAELAREVIAVELIPALAQGATKVLTELGYANATVHLATEGLGWPAAAPYDAIVVAAAAPRVPQSLVDQLAPGGRLVLPVGERDRQQDLIVVENRPEGLSVQRKGACGFVPLIGKEAYAANSANPAAAT